jgi:hypothetical protein
MSNTEEKEPSCPFFSFLKSGNKLLILLLLKYRTVHLLQRVQHETENITTP